MFVTSERDVEMRMRDGTTLRADVYTPSGDLETQRPTVLLRTPYDKSAPHAELDVDAYLRRDYAVVIQDVRGRYRSDGSHYHGRDEVEDGHDTLAWIADQPWSNGRVGMTGLSYPAAVQHAAACSGSPHLWSLFHVKAPSHYYLNGARRGGNFLNYLVGIEFLFACTAPEALADPALARTLRDCFADAPTWLSRLPLRRGQNPLTPIEDVESFFLDLQEQTEYTDFWRSNKLWSFEEYVDDYASEAAGLFVGGWYDLYREDRFYSVLRGRASRPLHLLMGPWGHRDFEGTLGTVDFGPEAPLLGEEYTRLQLAWFDESLKDVAPSSPRPAVTVFTMGGGTGARTPDGLLDHGGRWRHGRDWPLPETEFTPFYLHEGGRLSTDRPLGSVPPSTYLHDPEHPVPTIGGTNYFIGDSVLDRHEVGTRTGSPDLWVPYGPHDQVERRDIFACTSDLPLWSRRDVLTFETPPLESEVEVTGPIEATFWLASSAVDTDLIIKLVDVYPGTADYPHGYAMNLADGVLRASYRLGFERRVLLEPDEVYEVRLGPELIYPTSNLFAAGHKIRLHIASSDYPAYEVNPGHGGPPWQLDLPVRARNRIFHDADRPSHILLPIVPT